MKRNIFFFWILFTTLPCSAQWHSIDLGAQVGAFGVHDTFFFVGMGRHVYRYTVAHGYSYEDTGIDFSQGTITSFASLGNYFFAGMGNGPAYQTTDDGSLWVGAATAAPVGTNGVYLFGQYVDPSQIIRSTDSGNDWEVMTNLSVSSYAAIGIDIFANTTQAIWRSTDTGNHWTQLTAPFPGTMTTMGSLLFVVGKDSLAESTDSGTLWNIIPVDSATTQEQVTCLATDGKNLFAGTMDGVYASTDTGKTWRQENDGLGKFLIVNQLGVFDTLLFVNAATDIIGTSWYTASRPIPEMTKDTTSSVAQIQSADSLSIYPNPASGMVTIIAGNTFIEQIRVLNVLGEDVLSTSDSYQSKINLDLSKIPSGTYFLEIQTANGTKLRKIVMDR